MALRQWGQVTIQPATPGEAPIQVGSLWVDTTSTATLKVCTSVSPYTFSAITGAVAVAGSTSQIQFNSAGVLGASANLTWDGTAVNIGGQSVPGTVRFQVSGGDVQVNLTDITASEFLMGFPANNATLRMWNAVHTETVNIASNDVSYVPSLRVSDLTSTRATFAGASGRLMDYASITYEAVNTGGGGTNTGRPTLSFRPAGSSTNQYGIGLYVIHTNAHPVGAGSFPLNYFESTANNGGTPSAGDGGSILKVRGVIAATNGDPAGAGGIDIFATADVGNTGHVLNLGTNSLWAWNRSGAACDNIIGAVIIGQNSNLSPSTAANGSSVTLLMPLGVAFDGNGLGLDTTVGTIIDMIGIRLFSAGITGATVTNRVLLQFDAMAGTASAKDYVIDSQATQASRHTGSIGIGTTAGPATKLHVVQNSGQGTFAPGYASANTAYATTVTSASLTAIPAAVSGLILIYGQVVDQEISFTSNPGSFTLVNGLSTFAGIKTTDTAVYPAGSYLASIQSVARYEGTGSIPNVYGASITASVGGTGNVGTQAFALLLDNTTVAGASSGTTALGGGLRINRPTSVGTRTTTTYIGLQIDRQDSNAGAPAAANIYAIKQIGTTDLIFWGAPFSTYANIATKGWGVPAVYAFARATGQNAANASIATYTVGAADGTFKVSGYVYVTTATAHSFTMTCAYTDPAGNARVLTLPFTQLAGVPLTTITNVTGAGPYEGIALQIRCKASTTITFATAAGGTYTTVTYDAEGLAIQVA